MQYTHIHNRRSIRLKDYDYSQPGWYFITICTKNREMLFGDVVDGNMVLNSGGKIVKKCWSDIPAHFPNVILDEYVIMPNHVHGIINIVEIEKNLDVENKVRAKNFSPLQKIHQKNVHFHSPLKTIGSIVRCFKIGVTKWFRKNTDIYDVWQRNYYERIIRDEPELNKIRKYILDNPGKWEDDKYYNI